MPIAQLGVGQAVVFLRWRGQRLEMHFKTLGPDADLSLLGHAHRTLGNNDITIVELGCELELHGVDPRLGDADLKIAGMIAQGEKHQLTHRPVLDAATRHHRTGPPVGN